MNDPGPWQGEQLLKDDDIATSRRWHTGIAASEPLGPVSINPVQKVIQGSTISGDTEVGVVATELPLERCVLLGHRPMSEATTVRRHFLQRTAEAFRRSLPLDDWARRPLELRPQ